MKVMLIVRLCMNYDPFLRTVILPHGHSRKVTNLTYICKIGSAGTVPYSEQACFCLS